MENDNLTLRDLHTAYANWAGKPIKVNEYRKDNSGGQIPSELDILCYQSAEEDNCTDEEYVSFLVTAGVSIHRMQGTIEYAELFLQVKGRKYKDSLDELSRKLAEFAVIPFRYDTYFSPNRIIDGFSFPLFEGMDSVLLTNWGVHSPTYLPCGKREILLLDLHPIFQNEAEIIGNIGDTEASKRFEEENIDWDVPDRKPAKLKS